MRVEDTPDRRSKLARFIRVMAVPIVLAWLALTVATNVLLPSLEKVGADHTVSMNPTEAPSYLSMKKIGEKIRGREEHSESKIAMNGGLDLADITLLLAIQDILRDDVQGALSTLHGPQKEWVEKWKEVLDPHEDALREALGLDGTREPRPLSRSAAPRVAPAHDEEARRRFNVGYETMRLRSRSLLGAGGGGVLGLFAGLLAWRVVLGPPAGDVAYAAVHGGVIIVLGTVMFNVASRQIPAVAMAVFAQSEMLFVPIWAFVVLAERPSLLSIAGGAIIATAIVGKAVLDARARAAAPPMPAEVR